MKVDSGGGAGGKVKPFCPNGSGLNRSGSPGLKVCLFLSDVINLFSLGVKLFSYQDSQRIKVDFYSISLPKHFVHYSMGSLHR